MSVLPKIQNKILSDIESHGQSVIGVQGTDVPSFAYTIGLFQEFGFELLCLGLKPENSAAIFNDVAKSLRDGAELALNVGDDRFSSLPIIFVEADGRAHDYVIQADEFFGKKIPVVQMVMSDRAGILPGAPGYDHAYMDKFQALLFDVSLLPTVESRPRGLKLH